MWLRALVLSLLSVLAVACGSEAASPGGGDHGVRGVVLLGPQCPVIQQNSPCPDTPMAGVVVRAVHDGDVVAEATTDDRGRYELVLSPGRYVLEAVIPQDAARSAKPVDVVVPEDGFADATVMVDTGIR